MLIAGVDEVGRGPLVGDVVAAAVILPDTADIPGLTDSKKLSAKKREQLFEIIHHEASALAIGRASPKEIDTINILNASLLAMKRAIESLAIVPDAVKVDGRHPPDVAMMVECIVQGDLTVAEISAASIIAKVTRDREMVELDEIYPQYGFAKHKGYPTAEHRQAILEFGITEYHRRSFGPCQLA